MGTSDNARLEEFLDWLAGAVAARLPGHTTASSEEPTAAAQAWPVNGPEPQEGIAPHVESVSEGPAKAGEPAPADQAPEALPDELPAPAAGAPSHAAPLLARLAIGLIIVVALINIPLGLRGTAIARMIPSSTSLVIRDGLLVKESDKPEVYVYQGGMFHWITDLDAFARSGYRWENVREVEPGFLADYTLGRPVYLLAKCPDSPHVYRLQDGTKRWIVDIATFEAQGYRWADVQMMDCYTLRAIPMGETIPPGRGPAPEP